VMPAYGLPGVPDQTVAAPRLPAREMP
jgi:hypothetical protein